VVSSRDIERCGRILAQAAQAPARVILFGSYARGGAERDSDLDFLVIEREVEHRTREAARLRAALPPLGVPVDVLVMSEAQAAERARVKGSTVARALAEGRVVADA
jgi:predicted nucleotidyltransferase